MWQRDTDFDMVNDEAKILSAVDPPCPSMVMLCTESKAEINAGLVIVTSSRRQRPFTVNDAAADMVIGLLDSRRQYVTSEEHDLEYDSVAASGLLWTPLASCKASQPLHWTHAWALLGEWSGHIAFPLPTLADDGSHDWPRHGTACLLQPEFRRRLPFFFLRLPYGQYGPVSQLSRSEKSCTGPFNWGEVHCAGENVKRRTGPFQRKSLTNQTRTTTQQRGAARHGNRV